MQVSYHSFSLPLRSPLETSNGVIERRAGVLVRIEWDGGTGIGEATPLPGWTESRSECRSALDRARERLDSIDPKAVLASLRETPAARHGLALAFEDRAARLADRPLYRHFGTHERVATVPANATIGDGDVDETVSLARDAIRAGFHCLKVKVGARSIGEDVARLAGVRDVVGEEVTLRADANGGWGRREAEEAIGELADLDVEYVEQPLEPLDLDGLAALRGGPVRIAVDETLATIRPSTVIEAGAADVLIVKPMVLGGPDRALDVLRRAEAAGLSAVVTTTVDAAVARAAAVHLTACVDEPLPAGLATADRLAEDVATDPAPVDEGNVPVPQSSGHGVRMEEWSP